MDVNVEQVRSFRLRAHHLDRAHAPDAIADAVGARRTQNMPPEAWEAALFNRVPSCSLRDMEHLLDEDKALVQAWSLRGAPVVFPAGEASMFLSACRAMTSRGSTRRASGWRSTRSVWTSTNCWIRSWA